MRVVQKVVQIIGATSLGTGAGALIVYAGLMCVFPEPRGENFGGALFWLGAIFGGAALGALAGSVAASLWTSRHDSAAWSPRIWAGAALGLLAGLLLVRCLPDRYYLWFWLCWAALLVPACSAAGGLVARMTCVISKGTNRDR